MNLFQELQRRNVFRVGAAYLVSGWLLAQVADLAADAFAAPDWVMQMLIVVLALGFPIALFFAWVFELTPEGIKLEKDVDRTKSVTSQTGQRLNRGIVVILTLAVLVLLVDRLWMDRPTAPADSSANADQQVSEVQESAAGKPPAPRPAGDQSVAVLPFVSMSRGEDDEYFADGLTEEILNALTAIPDLMVTARTSAFAFKGKNLEVPQIAARLGVAHVVEGSVRRANDRVRVTAQLIRASDGFHLWSDTYDRTLEDVFAIQEDIAHSIVRALDVVLDDHLREIMERSGTRNVDAFIRFQKGYDTYQRAHGGADQIETLIEANRYFEAALETEPGYSQAHLLHSDLFTHLLLLQAAGQPIPPAGDPYLPTATEQVAHDLARAAETAVHDFNRANAELARVFLSNDWRRLPGLMDAFAAIDACISPLWGHLPAPFGQADRIRPIFRHLVQCDPAREQGWVHAAMLALWTGDLDEAMEKAQAGIQALDSHERVDYSLMVILLARGDLERFAALEQSLTSRWRPEYAVWLAAYRNEMAEARRLADALDTTEFGDDTAMQIAAMLGDRERANALAAAIDARPLGPAVLALATYHCACGAPFDLEQAPNLQRQIGEARFDWPPPTLIRYPGKNW